MRHLYIGAEITRNSKTGCGIKLEDLPRIDDSVPYKHHALITCEKCNQKAAKISLLKKSK